MGHLGLLKAKLAKLRRDLITPKSGGGGRFPDSIILTCNDSMHVLSSDNPLEEAK